MVQLADLPRFIRTLKYIPPQQIWARLDYKVRDLYFRTPAYALLQPPPLDTQPPQLVAPTVFSGSPERGKQVQDNHFTLVNKTRFLGNEIDWYPQGASALWVFELHYHDWLADLRAIGTGARPDAQRLLEDWLAVNQDYHPIAWHPYPLSCRLINWCQQLDWVLKDASDVLIQTTYDTLHWQARHLSQVLEWDKGGNHLLKNLVALICVGLCSPDQKITAAEALQMLLKQLKIQFLEDGCHYERSPHYQAQVLADLVFVRLLLRKAKYKIPPQLDVTIDKASAALAFLRHSDGKLSQFNDSTEHSTTHLNQLLKKAGEDAPTEQLSAAGYYQLAAGETRLLLDAGPVCPDELPGHAHADTLSFELTRGKQRVFVNSGTFGYQVADRNEWRGTAAKNTVSINRDNSAEVWSIFRVGRRPRQISAAVQHEPGVGVGWTARHDGYRHQRVQHQRQVFLSADGNDLRGEDTLTKIGKRRIRPHIAAHFHLHPSVRCQLLSPQEAQLVLADGTVAHFKIAPGGRLYEMRSHYSPTFNEKVPNIRLVYSAPWQGSPTALKWALKFEN